MQCSSLLALPTFLLFFFLFTAVIADVALTSFCTESAVPHYGMQAAVSTEITPHLIDLSERAAS